MTGELMGRPARKMDERLVIASLTTPPNQASGQLTLKAMAF
ncbi:hypothetical protein ACE0DR_05520 [Azotobacter sp. CWF10]